MKRVTLIALFAAAALALASGAALAQSGSLISVGVEMHSGDDSHVYFYGEVGLTPLLTGSFEFANNHPLVVGLWYGVTQGFYGELSLSTGNDSRQAIEAGVWKSLPISDKVGVTGWIGAATELNGSSDIWAAGGAEVTIPLAETFALFAGAETTLLKNDGNTTTTWAGLGLYF